MGVIDRSLRIVVGAALIYFGLVDTALVENQIIRIVMAFFGVMNLTTSIIGFCPLYTLADLSTVSKSKD
jgi:hypothetical protein